MFVQICKSKLEQRYEVKTKPSQKITELNVSDTFYYFYFLPSKFHVDCGISKFKLSDRLLFQNWKVLSQFGRVNALVILIKIIPSRPEAFFNCIFIIAIWTSSGDSSLSVVSGFYSLSAEAHPIQKKQDLRCSWANELHAGMCFEGSLRDPLLKFCYQTRATRDDKAVSPEVHQISPTSGLPELLSLMHLKIIWRRNCFPL